MQSYHATTQAQTSRFSAIKAITDKTARNIEEIKDLAARNEPGVTSARMNELFIEMTGKPLPKRLAYILN